MSRFNFVKNKIVKKQKTHEDVFRTLDGTIWHDHHPTVMHDYKISYIEGVSFKLTTIDNAITQPVLFYDLVREYEIDEEYEERLYDAIHILKKTGYILKTKEEMDAINLKSQTEFIDNILNVFTKEEIDSAKDDDFEEDLLDEMISEEDAKVFDEVAEHTKTDLS